MSSNAPSDPVGPEPGRDRNGRVALYCVLGLVGMTSAAYASVPLYKAFCDFTGFDGATRRAETASQTVLGKTLTVRFDANVRGGLPWAFETLQASQTMKIGETKLAFFKVTNRSDKPVTGRAIYNVVPSQAGPYFQKLQCFCFEDQTLQPGQTVEVPVLYFIDPKYAQDINTRGKPEVTLSYTFYPSTEGADQVAVPLPEKKG